MSAAIYAFHAHLDECERCRERPFDLCPVGIALLLATSRVPAASRDPNASRATGNTADATAPNGPGLLKADAPSPPTPPEVPHD